MTRSLYVLGAAALARTGAATAAAGMTYQLSTSFNYLNFFDSFDFFESNFTTGNYNDVDPTSGYVDYRSSSDAGKLSLISTTGTEVYIGVDNTTVLDPTGKGRSSVRIESKQSFNSGLFVAKFSHLPAPVCGAWPSYWMYGSNWPANGEIDIYENWNNAAQNLMALHTDSATDVGACLLVESEMTDPIVTANCANDAAGQYSDQGCSVSELDGQWGSSTGGVYATEWTDDAISIWSWPWGSVPSDVDANPDPSSWGTPHLRVTSGSCNIADAFNDQKIVLDIDFCGTTAGNSGIWGSECGTLADTCIDYVAANPGAFTNVFWQIQSINVFQLGAPEVTTTSTTTTTSSKTSTTTTTTTTTTGSTTASTGSTTASTTTTTQPSATVTSTSSRAPYSNSTITSGSAVGSTTSTIITTSVYTVTSCPPTVKSCPVGQVTTETITLGTTICPVTATQTSAPAKGTSSLPAGWTTSTVYTTKTYTVTSCAATVTDCPARIGKVTTETVALSTTVCPVAGGSGAGAGAGKGKGATFTTTTKAPVVQVTATVVPQTQSTAGSSGSSSAGKGGSAAGSAPYAGNSTSTAARPNGSAASSGKAPGATSSPTTVGVSGGVQAGASLAMVLLGAAAVFAL